MVEHKMVGAPIETDELKPQKTPMALMLVFVGIILGYIVGTNQPQTKFLMEEQVVWGIHCQQAGQQKF